MKQQINQADDEIAQGNIVDKMEENVNNVKKAVCKPHNQRGTVRSQTQALSQLAASTN